MRLLVFVFVTACASERPAPAAFVATATFDARAVRSALASLGDMSLQVSAGCPDGSLTVATAQIDPTTGHFQALLPACGAATITIQALVTATSGETIVALAGEVQATLTRGHEVPLDLALRPSGEAQFTAPATCDLTVLAVQPHAGDPASYTVPLTHGQVARVVLPVGDYAAFCPGYYARLTVGLGQRFTGKLNAAAGPVLIAHTLSAVTALPAGTPSFAGSLEFSEPVTGVDAGLAVAPEFPVPASCGGPQITELASPDGGLSWTFTVTGLRNGRTHVLTLGTAIAAGGVPLVGAPLTFLSVVAPRIVFVSTDGTGDGTTSAQPASLPSALGNAAPGDEMRLSTGDYPQPGGVTLATGVSLIGGYSRNFASNDNAANPTQLQNSDAAPLLTVSDPCVARDSLVQGLSLSRGPSAVSGQFVVTTTVAVTHGSPTFSRDFIASEPYYVIDSSLALDIEDGGALVSDCLIDGGSAQNNAAVHLGATSNVDLVNNSIWAGSGGSAEFGLTLARVSAARIINNIFFELGDGGQAAAISAPAGLSSGVWLQNNVNATGVNAGEIFDGTTLQPAPTFADIAALSPAFVDSNIDYQSGLSVVSPGNEVLSPTSFEPIGSDALLLLLQGKKPGELCGPAGVQQPCLVPSVDWSGAPNTRVIGARTAAAPLD